MGYHDPWISRQLHDNKWIVWRHYYISWYIILVLIFYLNNFMLVYNKTNSTVYKESITPHQLFQMPIYHWHIFILLSYQFSFYQPFVQFKPLMSNLHPSKFNPYNYSSVWDMHRQQISSLPFKMVFGRLKMLLPIWYVKCFNIKTIQPLLWENLIHFHPFPVHKSNYPV